MILVDTSVWIDFLKGNNSRQRQVLHKLIEEEEDISLTEIILTEILQGIKKDKDFQKIKKYLLEFPILKPNGIETYIKAAQIYRGCRKNDRKVGKRAYCIIAAICIEKGLTLLHKDSDFDSIGACTALMTYKI